MSLSMGPRPPGWLPSGAGWRADRWTPRREQTPSRVDRRKTTHGEKETMAELTIRPEEIRDALARFVQDYEPEGASREEVGTVIECGDGIARVEGLPSAMASELLEFENGVRGLALNLDV